MKTPRFIKEYANNKISFLHGVMKENPNGREILTQKIEQINKIVRLSERGTITIDETMKSIAEA